MKIGMVFPGQGSQVVGMAKNLYDQERLIQEYFEQASSCLDQNFVQLCFASSDKELTETVNAQTAIFLVSASIVALLKEKYGIKPDLVAGHSLGEYSALFAAGGMNFADALYLLRKRAQFMSEATITQQGGMMAVLNVPMHELTSLVARIDQPSGLETVLEVVNYNTQRQVVVSGTLAALEQLKTLIAEIGGRCISLSVAGAFHSRLMKEAQKRFSLYLEKVDFHDLQTPLVNNVHAAVITQAQDVKQSLVEQIASPVHWWQSLQQFRGCDIILEIGPGTKLAKMIKQELPDKVVISINEQSDIDQLLNLLGRSEQTSVQAEL